MSDYVVKIIPSDPHFHCSEQTAKEIVDYLKSIVTADDIKVEVRENPVFVDCGSNLEKILCPLCKTPLDFDWWGEEMAKASECDFNSLSVKLPCCGRESSLNDLLYHFPCGFSSVEIDIINPLSEPDRDCLEYIQKSLGNQVRVINAHM